MLPLNSLHSRYYCAQPEIDLRTQAAVGCTKDRVVTVRCYAVPNVTICNRTYGDVDSNESDAFLFTKDLPCRYV